MMLRSVPACNKVMPAEEAIGASHVIIEKNTDDCNPKNNKNNQAFRDFQGDLAFSFLPVTAGNMFDVLPYFLSSQRTKKQAQ